MMKKRPLLSCTKNDTDQVQKLEHTKPSEETQVAWYHITTFRPNFYL